MTKNATLARAISCVMAASALGTLEVQAQEQAAEGAARLEGVVVTGSRIRHDAYSSPNPVDIVVPESATAQGIGSISGLLRAGTVAAGSPQVTSASSTAFVEAGGTGSETLSLRGLGANRTLVLLNGRRAGPAGTRGEVSAFDFNVMPLSVVERVEILKDGASSIYGSDAVAGVVNIITRKGDGATADAFIGVPSESGGEESRFNASWGKSFDRGNFRVTGDYHRESELQKGDRDYFSCAEQYIFDPATGNRADVIDPRTSSPACRDLPWGHVWVYEYNYTEPGNLPAGNGQLMQYDFNAELGQFIPPLTNDGAGFVNQFRAPTTWYPVAYDRASDGVTDYDHPFQDGTSLIPKMERATVFVDGEFNITDNVTAYAEVLLNRRKTTAGGYQQFWTYKYTSDFNFYDAFWNYTYTTSPGTGDPLSAGWTGAQVLSPLSITDRAGSLVEVDYQRYVAGIRGTLKSNWDWDVSVQYSDSDGDYTTDVIFADSIYDTEITYAGAGVFDDDGNVIVPGVPYEPVATCVGTFSSVRGAPCVDIPWLDQNFLAGNFSQEVSDFLFGVDKGNTQYEQLSVEAYMSGTAFDLPAGPLGIAFGIHYQTDEIRDVPGEATLAGNSWGASSAGITAGDDTTKAVFAEFDIPLLRDKPMADSLVLTASGRYTDVDSYGSGDTYKVGLNWGITQTFRIRMSEGTSFRTPALFELYLADQSSFIAQQGIDPCIGWGEAVAGGEISQTIADNCAAEGWAPDFLGGTVSATVFTGGGLGVLEAETSTSRTVGFVWQPKLPDLSLSVDYFDIEIRDEVQRFGADNIVFNCYDSEFFPAEPLCDLFERDLQNDGIDNVRDSFINIASQKNRGWDLALLYRTSLPWGQLTIETQHTYQEEDVTAVFAQTPEDQNGRLGDPEWVGHLNLTFDRGAWSFFWGTQFVGSSSSHQDFERRTGSPTAIYRGEAVDVVLKTDTVMYHTGSVSRQFEDWGLSARLGVANLLDEEPPRVTTIGAVAGEAQTIGQSAFYSQYDWIGRRYFLNLTKTF